MNYENWLRTDHAGRCGCVRCRRQARLIDRLADRSLSVALRHSQSRFEDGLGLEAATPSGSITLPGRFSGWRDSIVLYDLLMGSPPAAFKQKSVRGTGPGYLYRIYEENKQIPLYIGMAFNEPIQDRVTSHFRGLVAKSGLRLPAKTLAGTSPGEFAGLKSEIAKLKVLVAQLPQSKHIRVQYGTVAPNSGYPMDPKFLHAFESALQVLEHPRSYVGSARTFEDVLMP